jgi:hypothetical protein
MRFAVVYFREFIKGGADLLWEPGKLAGRKGNCQVEAVKKVILVGQESCVIKNRPSFHLTIFGGF